MAEEGKGGVREGLRNSVGLLVAFKEAVQETFEEARDRGDFSTDKARALVQEAAQKVQHTVDEARERIDLVSKKDLDALKTELDSLRSRVARLEAQGSVPEAGEVPTQSDPATPASDSMPFQVD